MKQRFGILIIGLLLIGCKVKTSAQNDIQESQAQQQEKVNNLKVFAKAYGYVKYFHPSDEASKIDWNSFAAYGANEILKSNNRNDVIATLNNLFKPIAPGVVFSNTKQDYDMSTIIPNIVTDYKQTYWQHLCFH